MKLTNRLACVASKVPKDSIVADIGTDHAYVPVFLVKNKIIERAIACDINKGPLERAKEHIRENGLTEFIEMRLGPGLEVIMPGEADTIIIAGMGGMLIRDILANSQGVLDKSNTLILQPMIAQEVVREWLYNNGFRIIDEELAREDYKIYTIIVAEHGQESVDEIHYDIGKKLIEKNDPLLMDYLKKKMNELEKILISLEGETTENAIRRKEECQIKLNKYKDILK